MFNPLDFLNLAKVLATGNEAEIRTSVSRAYYAAFLNAREWLRARNWNIYNDVRDHREVEKGLKRFKGRGIKDKIAHLRRDYRNKADYVLTERFIDRHASDAISLAQIIIKRCSP